MRILPFIIALFLALSCTDGEDDGTPGQTGFQLVSIHVGSQMLALDGESNEVSVAEAIVLRFAEAIDPSSVEGSISLKDKDENDQTLSYSYLDNNKTISVAADPALQEGTTYTLMISDGLKGEGGETFEEFNVVFTTAITPFEVSAVMIGNQEVDTKSRIQNVALSPEIQLTFTATVDVSHLTNHLEVSLGSLKPTYELSQISDQAIKVKVTEELMGHRKYQLSIADELVNGENKPFAGFSLEFYTEIDSTLKFPEITDDELLTKIQEQTFAYFWDFAHPVSGLIRERNSSGDLVTTGGSGFGLMAIIVGIERGFITRAEGVERWETIVDFLQTKAERYHGAWAHWLNGSTGKTIPFSTKDDGGDLVETSFLIQGLLTVREYLNAVDPTELAIQTKINQLWQEVEWDWYTQGGQSVLYWHWSENFGWEKNLKISGWNESLITYVLAASSTTHSIPLEVYTSGWAKDGAMVNTGGVQFFGQQLPLRSDQGGPLFFSHYSFLGLDPRNLEDQYANYWDQNVRHSLINQAYCSTNPKNYVGYSDYCWGLTASDGDQGYSAHSPDNDRGVITPTAAVSALPYVPEESMKAIKHFYYIMGDRLWGIYGFADAFNVTENWTAGSYLAIDQGPIVLMIENHRSALLWNLFMSAPEVQAGLTKLNFTSFNVP